MSAIDRPAGRTARRGEDRFGWRDAGVFRARAALPAPWQVSARGWAALPLIGLLAVPLVGQERDTTRTSPDTVAFRLQGLRVEASRPTITSGGATAVELVLDSALHLPSPTLADVLGGMPLIRIRRNSRGEVQPSLRGMEEREIAVLVDGVPITIGWDNRTDLSIVPLTAAREVRFVRGLSSMLAGPNALGGVVEVRIAGGELPATRPPPARLRFGLDQTGGVATSAEGGRLWRHTEGGRATWLRFGGGYRQSDGAPLARGLPDAARGSDGLLVNSDLKQANGFLALRHEAGGGSWVALSSTGFWNERGVVPELHLLGGPNPEPRFWRIPNQWRSVTALSGGSGWSRTPWGSGDLEATVGVDVQRTEIDAFESIAFADSVDGETGEDLTLSFRLLGDHTLGPGILRGGITYAETWHDQTLAGEGTLGFRQRLWSLGFETEQPLGSADGTGTRASVTGGFSVDGAATPETGDKPPQPAIWGWGVRAAGRVLLGGDVELHGGVSRKIRFPALREMFSGALGKFAPNPELGPVTLKVGEVGVTARPRPELEIQGTLFQQRLQGSIVRVVLEDGRFQRRNLGETRSTGVELVGSWRRAGYELLGDLTLQRVRRLDDDGRRSGEKAEYQPDVSGGIRASRAISGPVRVHAQLEIIGTQFGANPQTGEFEAVDPSAYLALGATGRFASPGGGFPPLTLSATLENLTDEAIFGQLGLPRPGRTLRVQVELF